MRDLLITLVVFGSLPFIFKKPYLGVIMWVWLSVMSPQTQAWGFAQSFPFAAIVAGTTMTAMLFNRIPKSIPANSVTFVLAAFTFWMCVTTIFAFEPERSYATWNQVMKIMLMTFVSLALIKTKEQIQQFIWIIVLSLGYYGVKGGIFTIASGGTSLVFGPGGTFMGGNNELALGLVTIIPMIWYLHITTEHKWIRRGLLLMVLLCVASAIGSYSRGALLGLGAIGTFLWLKSQQKLRVGLLLVIIFPIVVMFMPDRWSNRMDTIETYQKDESAQGRINAWWMTFNLAKDRPLVGGGYAIYDSIRYAKYALRPSPILVAHSVYFQALGEHGFVGLALYLMLGIGTWINGRWVIRHTLKDDNLRWAFNLATMIQVSLIGFAVGGAFLSLLYFDVPYYLMVAMISLRVLVASEVKSRIAVAKTNTPRNTTRQFGPQPVLRRRPEATRTPPAKDTVLNK